MLRVRFGAVPSCKKRALVDNLSFRPRQREDVDLAVTGSPLVMCGAIMIEAPALVPGLVKPPRLHQLLYRHQAS